MKKFFLILSTVVTLLSTAHATTAVMCGEPEKVDQDNNLATIWLILDSSTPEASDEVKAIFSGKEAKVTKVNRKSGNLIIQVSNPKKAITIDEESINSSCDGETLFSVSLNSEKNHKIISNCRCFED